MLGERRGEAKGDASGLLEHGNICGVVTLLLELQNFQRFVSSSQKQKVKSGVLI
jgi:hypothetical protein